MTIRRSLFAVALALALAAPIARAELRTYEVDAAYRDEVFEVLRGFLSDDVDPNAYPQLYGHVELLPSGQLLVEAAPEKQAEIAQVLEAVASRPAGQTPMVTLNYWVLFGEPGAEDSPRMPSILDGVVDQLEALHGDLGFRLLDSASVSSRVGDNGVLASESIEIVQHAYQNGDLLNARVTIDHENQEISVDVNLRPGEFVVLGASSGSDENGARGTFATVVNWAGSR